MNSTAIKVTWRAPLQPNGEISYRLYFWQSSQGFETSKLAYDGMLLEYTVADLHEYVTYTFMIQAYNVKYSWKSTGTNVSETTHPAGKFLTSSIARVMFELLKVGNKFCSVLEKKKRKKKPYLLVKLRSFV